MARVTDTDVKELVEVDEDTDIDWAVETAYDVVTKHLDGVVTPATLLTRIELFIAAHLVSLSVEKGAIVRESTGTASANYANIYGEGFRATRWGQQALALDYTGTLLKMTNTKLRAEFDVV